MTRLRWWRTVAPVLPRRVRHDQVAVASPEALEHAASGLHHTPRWDARKLEIRKFWSPKSARIEEKERIEAIETRENVFQVE